ncbi:phytanoyl-CoA dioxygenase [Aureococcus anophagefferens]|uniref:Phytanoyl-CoA dioxygenase n=1 Tax=Aureococcus anophagefferens TaxID=44056 RepID=A0ABR1GD54_AURAN
MEMAQLPGRWDGHRAYVSRVLCGQDCGEAARRGGLLGARAELAAACLPYLDRVHVDFCLSEKGTAAFVAHTVPEPGAVGDDAEEVPPPGRSAARRGGGAAAVAEEPEFDLDDVIDAAVLAAPGASAPGAAVGAPDWASQRGRSRGSAGVGRAAGPRRGRAGLAEKPDRAEAEPAWPEKPNRAEAEPAWRRSEPRAARALATRGVRVQGRGAVDARRRAAAPRAVAAAGARRRARGPAYPIVVLPPIQRKGARHPKTMAEVDDKEEEPRAKRARVEKDDEASADAPAAAAKDDGLAVKAFSGGFGAAAAGDDGLAVKAFSGGFGGTFSGGVGFGGVAGGDKDRTRARRRLLGPAARRGRRARAAAGGGDAGDDPANVSNGEESERCVAKHRAKLFVLEKGDDRPAWKDRGVGALKVLEAAPPADEAVAKKRGLDGSVRVVMRREQIHSLMLNVKVGKPPHATVAKHGETALRVAAMTSATETATYLIRVKTAEERDGLFDALGGEAAPDE